MEYPTFFGETLPVISRAVDDDDDELLPHDINWFVSFGFIIVDGCGRYSRSDSDSLLSLSCTYVLISLM